MEIIYKANDGTLFNNESDCLMHEEKYTYKYIYSVELFTRFNDRYFFTKDNLFEDCNYSICEKVIIHNQEELAEFIRLADYCGWCEFYEQINAPGTWVRTEEDMYSEGTWTKMAAI